MKIVKKILNTIRAPRVEYQPLIEVRIFKDALLHNLDTYQKQYPKVQFVPVLKSNAYGHSLVEVANVLDEEGVPFFMVDSFYEALTLRRAGIKSKILILGYCRPEQILNNKLKNCSFGIIDLEQLKNIVSNLKNPQNFHLKVDTGMHRQGILVGQVEEAAKLIKSNSNFILEGVCSHFADADGENQAFTRDQIQVWNSLVQSFKKYFPNLQCLHASNTAGSNYQNQIDANVSRLGIGLYGVDPSPFTKMDLHPALEMTSLISSIREIPAKEKVGYGITFESSAKMIVATVPVGYNEGVDRRLSNKGFYKIGGTFCPIVGRVSMNMSSIDVTEVAGVKLENEVIVISRNKNDKNSVENIAKLCECIPYEILVHIPQHLRRVII